ncbi:MAG: hypothetical protein PHF37_10010 [Phycisphaerae bacterium]|nr:hypothetical protein [Phycisphaerae bacterium]
MSIKDYDIVEITSAIIDGMEQEKLYHWEDFCSRFIGMNIPPKNSKAYIYYVRERVAIKNLINAELVKRKQGCRLFVANQLGVTLMGTIKAPINTIATTMKKRTSLEGRTKNRLESFLNSPEVTDTYKCHLRAIVELSEGSYKNLIGHVVCSDKLPGYIKTAIINTLPKKTKEFLLGDGE